MAIGLESNRMQCPRLLRVVLVVPLALICGSLAFASACPQQPPEQTASPAGTKSVGPNQPPLAKAPTETEELQSSIDRAGNDRAALVHNLEEFLKKYPESRQRPQIYRALVEASLQLRDTPRAADYAERIVSIAPEDMSMTLLAIQLLERNGDEAALHRAVNYASRVLDYVNRNAMAEKSPKISKEEWVAEQRRDQVNILSLRGRLYFKLHDTASASNDFRASLLISPTSAAAEKLGEIAELNKDLPGAIQQYSKAFALSDASGNAASRREIRQKLGNVWRLAHGSDQGLGDYLLHAYDDVSAASETPKPKRNDGAKEPYEFMLRKAPDGSPYPFSNQKGKIVVLNFWATWCGPCRALEPHFERIAAQFQSLPDIVFLAADCDEDESLVAPYLEEEKPRTTVVFADGLETLLSVRSYPTVVILDRAGKIAYRAEGFDPDAVDAELAGAVRRLLAPPSAGGEKSN
jgi:thiol-disulfide isomerase/thioredoxin